MWKNTVEQGRPQLTIWRMSTNTHSEYEIITNFTLQKWSQEHVHIHVHCLSFCSFAYVPKHRMMLLDEKTLYQKQQKYFEYHIHMYEQLQHHINNSRTNKWTGPMDTL